MGRLLGFGFLIGAKDDGATRTTEEVAGGFDRVADAVERTSRTSQALQRFGNVIQSLNFMQLGRISSALDDIADRAGALRGIGDTTELEQFGAQFGQQWRAATAGLGEFRGLADQSRAAIASAAHTFQIGAEGMTEVAIAAARAGHTLEDYGLSARTLAGLEQAGVQTGEALGASLTSLSESYELGAEGTARLLDQLTALGERGGVALGPINQLQTGLEAADAAISALPPGVEGSVDDMLISLNQLAVGMTRQLGGTFESNFQGAVASLQQLSEARQQMGDVFAGLQGDFPELAQGLSVAFGSVDEALNTMMTDPASFVLELQRMYGQMDPARALRFQREVLSRFPESIRFMVMAGEQGAETLSGVMQPLENAEGALRRVGEGAASSSRTFAEAMELQEDAFRTRLNRMARRHYPNFERNVLQRQRQAFGLLEETINRHTAGDGPMARFGRVALALRRGGVTGLTLALEDELSEAFPNLSERIGNTLPLLGELSEGLLAGATQMGPLLMGLGTMGIRIPRISRVLALMLNPLTLVAAGIALVAWRGDRLAGDLERLAPRVLSFARSFETLSTQISDALGRVNWDEVGQTVMDGILIAFGVLEGTGAESEIAATIGRAFRNIFTAVGRMLRGLASGMWERISEWIMEPGDSMGRIRRGAAAIGVVLGAAMFTPMGAPLLAAARGTFSLMWRGVGMMVGPASAGVRAVGGAAVSGGRALAASLSTHLFGPSIRVLGVQAAGARGGLAWGLRSVGPAISGAATGMVGSLGGIFTRLGASMTGIMGRLGGGGAMAALRVGGRAALRFIPGIGAILGVLFDLPDIIRSFRTEGVVSGIQRIFTSIINGLLLGIPSLIESLTGTDFLNDIIGHIFGFERMRRVFDALGRGDWGTAIMEGLWNAFNVVTLGIPELLRRAFGGTDTGDLFGEIFGEMGTLINEVFGELRTAWTSIAQPIMEAMGLAWQEIQSIFQEVWGEIGTVVREVFTEFRTIFNEVVTAVRPIIAEIGTFVGELAEDMGELFREAVENLRPIFRELWEAIQSIGAAFAAIWTEAIQPAFQAIYAWYTDVFLGEIWPRWRRTLQRMGRAFVTMWRQHIRRSLMQMAAYFSRVFSGMQRTGVRTFARIATYITDRIFDVLAAIISIRERWRWMSNTIRANVRLLGAQLRYFFVMPMLRARNAVLTISEAIEQAFSTTRYFVVDMIHGMFRAIQDALTRLPFGERLARQIEPAVEAINRMREREEARDAGVRERIQRESRERREAMQREEAELARLQREARQAFDQGARDTARAERRIRDLQRATREAIQQAVPQIEEAFGTAAARLAQMSTEEGLTALRAARETAEREAIQQRFEAMEPAIEALHAARRGRGRITEEQATSIADAMRQAAMEGREVDVEAVTREIAGLRGVGRRRRTAAVEEAVRSITGAAEPEEEEEGGRRARPRRPRPRAAPSPAPEPSGAGARGRAREEARQEAELAATELAATAMEISNFGPDAMRQLREVFHGAGRGRVAAATPPIRPHPLASPPGGAAGEMA
jgi:hypothetical protein